MTDHTHTIACRARVGAGCYDGRPTAVQFGDDLPLDSDGTYDGSTIVCDACYVLLIPRTPSGQGLHHELDAAIAAMRAAN